MPKTRGHSWRFKARFRRHAFGWKSQPPIERLREALTEIKLVARIDPILGAEGAVALLERISPALENVDSSSGAIGTAVITRLALSPDKTVRGCFHGTSACLSALFAAGRYDELIELVRGDIFWPYKRWALKAMVAHGRHIEAITYAESCRNPWASDQDIDGLCARKSCCRLAGLTRPMPASAV